MIGGHKIQDGSTVPQVPDEIEVSPALAAPVRNAHRRVRHPAAWARRVERPVDGPLTASKVRRVGRLARRVGGASAHPARPRLRLRLHLRLRHSVAIRFRAAAARRAAPASPLAPGE